MAESRRPDGASVPWWFWLVPDQILAVPSLLALLGGVGAVALLRTHRVAAGVAVLVLRLAGLAFTGFYLTRRGAVSRGFAVVVALIAVSLAIGAGFLPVTASNDLAVSLPIVRLFSLWRRMTYQPGF